ncbi:cell wall-binding repeat-containing protein [Clostridium sp. MT-14]|uniref:cell wall-binding repeat-containing protein n=1 Tax=Clostridium sp. MT-14 TaxID=3348360 RepID=UPI0035F4F2B3
MKQYLKKTALFVLCCSFAFSGIAMPMSANADTGTDAAASQSITAGGETSANIKDITFAPGKDASQVNFTWYSNKDTSDPEVQVALKSDMTGNEFPESKAQTFKGEKSNGNDGYSSNKVTVTDLQPSKEYVYRVGDGTTWSSANNYTTQDISKGFNFLLAGDPQIGAGGDIDKDTTGWVDTVKKATDKFSSSSFILSVGDQVNNGKELNGQTNELEYDGFFKPDQLKNIPVAAITGNHEGYGVGHTTHFNYPNESDKYGIFTNNGYESDNSNGTTGNDYYFVYGNTLFLMLNSNDINAEDHKAFMQEAIAANPDVKWKIVSMHHSIYSSANHETDADIAARRVTHPEVFQELGIDVVLDGHDHCYTRSYQMVDGQAVSGKDDTSVTDPNGVLYITTNSASGSKYYEIQEPNYNNYFEAKKEQDKVPTFSNVSVTDKNFTITTYRTDTMAPIDSYTINKTTSHKNVSRLAGQNRYETAAKISQNNWNEADTAVLVSGQSYADALSAAPFAKLKNAPILLTSSNTLDSNTKSELSRLKVRTVYIIGGTGVVSSSIESSLRNMKMVVKRISGNDRYATSLEVAKQIKSPKQVFVASGAGFADGLSVSSYASLSGSPIILTDGKQLSSDILKYVKDNSSTPYVIGGNGVVDDSVVSSLGAVRISGSDRYSTNLAILNKFNDKYDLSNIYLASGSDFADALSGSAVAGEKSAPVVLIGKSDLSGAKNYIQGKLSGVGQITILGGEASVSQVTVNKLLQ